MIGGEINRWVPFPCDCCRKGFREVYGSYGTPRCIRLLSLGWDIDKTAMEACDWSVQLQMRKFARGSTLSISLMRLGNLDN